MSKQRSPFEALTSRERQERWLEFQSIRLPYVSASLDAEEHEEPEHREKPKQAAAPRPAATRAQASEGMRAADPPAPSPREQMAMQERSAFQQARHRQYDAVIKRMVEASRQAQSYRDAAPRA